MAVRLLRGNFHGKFQIKLFFRGTTDDGGSERNHSGKYVGTFPG